MLGLLFVVAGNALPSGAKAESSCQSAVRTPIAVDLKMPSPTIIDDQPRRQIRTISEQTGANPLAPGLLLNGLTVYHLESRHRIEVIEFPKRNGCFRPNRITASVDVKKLDVYIAEELENNGCNYRVTMAHELRHVAVLREGANRLKREIESALTDSEAFASISAPDIDTALKRYSTALNIIINDVRQSVSQEMVRRNRLLDTPEAYRADDAKCR